MLLIKPQIKLGLCCSEVLKMMVYQLTSCFDLFVQLRYCIWPWVSQTVVPYERQRCCDGSQGVAELAIQIVHLCTEACCLIFSYILLCA